MLKVKIRHLNSGSDSNTVQKYFAVVKYETLTSKAGDSNPPQQPWQTSGK